MTSQKAEPTGGQTAAGADAIEPDASGSTAESWPSSRLFLLLVNVATGEPTALLLETEPGIVEFPVLSFARGEEADAEQIVNRIRAMTGIETAVAGYLDEGEPERPPAGGRLLLLRVLGGRPAITVAHLGWEWRPLASLLATQFIPRAMANELRSYMFE